MAEKRLRSGSESLIPGLPDDMAHLCLSYLPPSLLFSVCSSWRRLLYSPLFPPFLSLYALFSDSDSLSLSPIKFMSFDPISGDWLPLPPPPPPVRLILRHPSFISRDLSVQSVSVRGKLVLVAGTGEGEGERDRLRPALPMPLVFCPVSGVWSQGPAFWAARRWCAAGTVSGEVFVGSGMGSEFSDEVARSFERWRPEEGGWERVGALKDGRFSREAVGAVGCRGKLWVVNAATNQGSVYEGGEWGEMAEKMVGGWKGPATAMEEEEIYVVDGGKGSLRRWDWEERDWVEVIQSSVLQGAQQITAARGRLCAVVKGRTGIVVVHLKPPSPTVQLLQSPPGYHAIALHVLPRMSATPM